MHDSIKVFVLGVIVSFLAAPTAARSISPSRPVPSDPGQLQVVNYASVPVYATAIAVDADSIYQATGITPSTPLQARDRAGRSIPLVPGRQDGRQIVYVYLALGPYEACDITFHIAKQWTDSLCAAQFDEESGSGFIRNGLIRLDYAGRNWTLTFDEPGKDGATAEAARQLVTQGEIDLWLDDRNRGRLLGYESDDLHELGLIHNSDAHLIRGRAFTNADGSVSLQLVRGFEGFAQTVTWTQTYTLAAHLPQLTTQTEFRTTDDRTLYLAYVNQGSGLAGRYGALLRDKPLFKYVDPGQPMALIAGGVSSPLIRVAWRPERCWIGLAARSGAGLGVATAAETKVLDRGSTVWHIDGSRFRATLIEEEQKHFPFTFSREDPFTNGLALIATSGGVDMWRQGKELFHSQTRNKPLELMQSYAVYLQGEPIQPGFVDKQLMSRDMLVAGADGRRLHAAVKLSRRKKYLLHVRAENATKADPLTVSATKLGDQSDTAILVLPDDTAQSVDLFDALQDGAGSKQDYADLVLTVNGPADRLAEFSLTEAPPAAPVLSTPRDGQNVTDFAVFFRWKKAPGMIDYELQFARDKEFSAPQCRPVRMETELAFYLPKDDELLEPGLWYWRVRALDGTTEGQWSPARSMTVNADHRCRPLEHRITPRSPLFTFEGCRIKRGDVGKFREILPKELRPYVAYVMTPLEADGLAPQENLVEYFAPLAGSDVRFFVRSLHPGAMADCFGSLSEVEAVFQQNPNVLGDLGGEAMSTLYRGGEETVFAQRLVRLCAKYGKLFYHADGTYPLDNKWEELYGRYGDFMHEYKNYFALGQKNNILQRQMLSQSSALGLYLSGAITNHCAWEDGGWYWQQVGFRALGELHGRRGGDVGTMPRIFWCLNFIMGISRGTAILSLEGQTGTAPSSAGNLSAADSPLAGHAHAYWTRDAELLPTYHRFIEPLFRAVIEHQLIPTKQQVLANIRLAVYNDGVEATEEQEPYYRQYQPLYAGTYGFRPMKEYPGELYEFFPNTGRYYYIPVLPQGKTALGDGIELLPLSQLGEADQVRKIFNAAYPEWYQGDALVALVGDTLTILNTNENLDETQSYNVPLHSRGIFAGVKGLVSVHSYVIGKFEDNNRRLWLQANTEYADRNTELAVKCRIKPDVRVRPASAAQLNRYDPTTGELTLRLSHRDGAVEVEISAQ